MSDETTYIEEQASEALALIEENIINISLAEIIPPRFLDYAMYVIQDRALPDPRDGLKPVHRRILFGMYGLGLAPNKAYKKCARAVGDVLGRFHPHGDTSVYQAMVVLAQEFSTRYPLVDIHGNSGSVDGDGAAAMRYTEGKLSPIGYEMLQDINKNVIDFKPNYDGSEQEPVVLGSLLPTMLMNGSFGIAVGLATKMPSHNLHDIYSACYYIIEKALLEEEPDEEEVINLIKAPDFATGGTIIGLSGVKQGYRTGQGKVIIRSKYTIEEDGTIIVYEIPYKVNKANMVEDIRKRANKYKDSNGKEKEADFPEIREIRDESDKDGMRIVIETKKDANVQLLINKLIKNSAFQTNYSMNMNAVVGRKPETLTLMQLLEQFLAHATSIIIRRSEFDLDKHSKRINLVNGILRLFESDPAVEEVELLTRVIDVIRTSEDPIAALGELEFNQEQAEYICEMKLRQLSNVSQDKFTVEKDTLVAEIDKLNAILNDNTCLLSTLKSEFETLDTKYSDERRTNIVAGEGSIDDEDLIEDETLIITYTSDAIIKAVEEGEYKSQKRGGKGVKGANTKEDEMIKFMFTSGSKDDLLFFTTEGRCHTLKAYKIGKSSKIAKGKSINNYLNLNIGEKIVSVINANLKDKENNLLFVTKQGYIKRLSVEQLSTKFNVTKVIGFKNEEDILVETLLSKNETVIVVTRKGMSIRIDSSTITSQGRAATGVIGIDLGKGDEVMDMCIVNDEDLILTITENGLGNCA